MAELGLIAAVVQIADVGFRLSVKLYTFGQTVGNADDSIVFISKDISHTCSILEALGCNLKKDREERLYNHKAISIADAIAKECLDIFHKMDEALQKKITRMGLDGSTSGIAVVALERLKWPFLKPRVMLLWSNLDKLKSSLHLMLNVLIYARLMDSRSEPSTIIDEQRIVIERLLHTKSQQSQGQAESSIVHKLHSIELEPSDAANLRNCGLRAANRVTLIPQSRSLTDRRMAQEANAAKRIVEHYCAFIDWLMQEIEATDHGLVHEMRCRIKDDIIRIHKRETRMLRAAHGHRGLETLMCSEMWRLAEMEDERSGAGGTPTIAHRGSDGLPATSQVWKSDLSSSTRSQDLGLHGRGPDVPIRKSIASQRRNVGPDPTSRKCLYKANFAIDRFLEAQDDPWHLEQFASGSSQGYHSNVSNKDSTPYLRGSVTSAVPTDNPQEENTNTSLQDVPTLTDSSDTTSFVTARSVVNERPSGNAHTFSPVEVETDGPLVVLDSQDYGEFMGHDDRTSGAVGLYTAWVDRSQLESAWPGEQPINGDSKMYQPSTM